MMYKVSLYLFLFVIFIKLSVQTLQEDVANRINNSNQTERTLSRNRRYLVFPTGSSLQLVYCLTVPSLGVGEIFTLGQTAALAWELPDKPEFIHDLISYKKGKTTTEAPETTTLPHLHHDHDYDDHLQYYDHPSERLDKPAKHFSGSWSFQGGKHPGAVNDMKTYYNPFLISKPSVYGYSSINGMKNEGRYSTLQRNSLSSRNSVRRPVYIGQSRHQSNINNYQKIKESEPVTSYVHPAYHQLHRRTRRDLYEKVEKLFTAIKNTSGRVYTGYLTKQSIGFNRSLTVVWYPYELLEVRDERRVDITFQVQAVKMTEVNQKLSKDGKACLLKAVCEVKQATQRKGTFMEEIIKVIFRVKPHDEYPDEDEYDLAANNGHNCNERYPTCEGTIWNSMLNP